MTRRSSFAPHGHVKPHKAMRAAVILPWLALLAACGGQARPVATAPAPVPVPVPATEQWLYGSAEGAIASRQMWDAIASHAITAANNRPATAVVLNEAGAPQACGDKPLAAIFDADETLIWNLGVTRYQSAQGKGFDENVWAAWEHSGAGAAVAMPGVVAALARLRAAGIMVIINTNRATAHAGGTIATLKAAGLGDFVHGQTLFLKGDTPPGRNGTTSDKDARRALVAARYCVVAMAGDQLGDFSDRLNARDLTPAARKAMAMSAPYAALWGRGWFLLSNPIYGPAIRGDFDEVYPPETTWEPPSHGAAKP